MNNRRFFLSTIVLMTAACHCKAQLVINELMQSNIDCVMDDLNEFPDSWVELYNAGTDIVRLQDYKIGLSKQETEAWQLPEQTVSPKQYVLVCCDKESQKLHTTSASTPARARSTCSAAAPSPTRWRALRNSQPPTSPTDG